MSRLRGRALAASLAAAVLALLAPAAAGAFSITNVTVTPQTPSGGPLPASGPAAAGAHPDLAVKIDFSAGEPADSVKDLSLHLAPGIVAFVNHAAKCSAADFARTTFTDRHCPADSVVGSASTDVTAALIGLHATLAGTIYNLDPPAGTPAALGIDIDGLAGIIPDVRLIATIGVDPHDLGLTASIHDIPNRVSTSVASLDLHVDSITQTLFGYLGNGNSFFTSPTACIPAAIGVSGTSYTGGSASNAGSYTPTDCDNEPFSTSLAIGANPSITDSPSEISADVKPGASDIPRVNSHVKNDTVTLPDGVLINPALAARLDACTDAQFAQSDTSVPASCPPSSAVGDIDFVSPILGSFPGKAYFGTQTPTDRLRLFLDVPLFGAHIKVSAHVHPSFTTGQITTVFDQLPQIAFTDFQLTFHSGPQSALVTPTTCGSHIAVATVFPWSGGPPSDSQASFTTSYDGKGAPCQSVFGPSIGASVKDPRSGASSPFTLTVDRPDRNVPIGRMRFSLPAGLIGNLALRGLTRCPLAQAAAGTCPVSSRIGPVAAVAGSGSQPPTLPGEAYLTEPKVKGDPAGLSIKVPAHLGPVDAGVVIVGVRLQLRSDGGLDATSDPIPALQQGIPLALRELRVTLDRPGFLRNPTSCGRQALTGSLDSLVGQTAAVATSLTLTDCGRLPFAPRFSTRLGVKGAFRQGGHPTFRALVKQRRGEAGIAGARVVLPTALAANLRAVRAACQPADLAAGRCSRDALAGAAAAVSPFVAGKLTGPVWFVSQGTGKLPKLVVQLRGPLTVQFEGIVEIGSGSNIATTFTAPDLPIDAFSLTLHGGGFGALTASRNLCAKPLVLREQFTGHNGRRTRSTRQRIAVSGCPKRHVHTRQPARH
jgi:hypothetical protein